MTLQRRSLLKAGLGAGAAAAVFPAWSAACLRPGAGPFGERIQAGRAAGKPVLVLLMPEAPDRPDRLELWSELLSVAGDPTLAELALCEVACARPADAAAAARSEKLPWPELSDGDVAVLLETDGGPPGRISDRGLPEVGPSWSAATDEARYEAAVRSRAAALAERLHAAILPQAKSLELRAAAVRVSLDEELLSTLVLDHFPRPRLAHLDRAAAIVLAEARAESSAEKEVNLARAALQRLWESAPSGAQWSSTTGYCPPCGMGYTPEISRHFLHYYAG